MALYEKYKNEIRKKLAEELNLNIMEVPRIEKIVVHVGWGKEAVEDPKSLEIVAQDLALIIGQKPVITRARKSVAQFKLRKGTPIGLKVTLRKKKGLRFP
jgi:LSU ribosomal protein L5P